MRQRFIETLTRLAEDDDRIFLICGDLGFSVLETFAERFPDRHLNSGIAEQAMVGMAAGLAMSGYTVFVYSIANFPTMRCLEQTRNDVCYHRANVKVVALGSGLAYGSHGYTHHAVEDVAIMSALPNMEVFTPADPPEVVAATLALASSGGPGYLRLSRSGEPTLSDVPLADVRQPHVLAPGRETVILAYGAVADLAIKARSELGGDVGVVSLPCLKPFPTAAVLELVADAKRIVTVEEHILRGGLHAALCAALIGAGRAPSVTGLGVPEINGHSMAGSRAALLAGAGLTVEAIVRDARG